MKFYRIRAKFAAIVIATAFCLSAMFFDTQIVRADEAVSEFVIYTVTFLTEDGDPILTEKVQKGKMASGPAEDPVSNGATFWGWKTEDGEAFDPKTDSVTGDLVLYAVFETAETDNTAELELGEPGVMVISDDDTPLAAGASEEESEEDEITIDEDDVPLAAAEDNCYVHWLILLLTLLAGGYNVAREFERIRANDEHDASQEV